MQLQLPFLIFIIGTGYSVEALTCHVCSSDKLAICATLHTGKKDLPFDLCPQNTESCFSKIENGITFRGCSPVETVEFVGKDHYEMCKTDKCNDEIFPEGRLHCLQCAGSSCIQADPIDVRYPCVNYDSNDKCYSVFYPDGASAYRGCGSEPGFGKTYCEQHVQQCVECSENGCNDKTLEWSKEKLSCIKCKSVDGKKCDEIGEDVSAEECMPVVEGYENECYTYVGKDGIERGCLCEASVDVGKKCSDKESCTLCKDSGCNRLKAVRTVLVESGYEMINVEVPAEQDKGDKLKSCYSGEMEPGKSNFTEMICKNRGDSCFTFINEGTVIKGCKVDYLQGNNISFENLSNTIYESCEKSLCNSQNIQQTECYACESISGTNPKCVGGTDLESKKCSLEMKATNCYHYVDDGLRLIKRGCMSDLKDNAEMLNECKNTGEKCKQCDGDRCNVRPNFSKCLGCKYPENPDCATNPANLSKSQTCKSYKDQCFTSIENKNVIRGCLGESEQQKKCLDGDKMCAVCDPIEEVNCNKQQLNLEQCIECDSKNDGVECRSNPKKFQGGICNGPQQSASHQGCFVSIVSDHYKRGCISHLSQSEKDKCLEQSNTCKSFSGDNSNDVISFQECYKCNSRDDPSCSNKLTPFAATEVCESVTSTCTTGIDRDGVTHRRCSKDESVEKKNFKQYETCKEAKCNSEIFPKNRLQCLRCNGDSDCDLLDEKNEKENVLCNSYSEHDQCYTYQDKDDKIYRGCLSDATNSRLRCELDPSKCIKCKESGCNNQPKDKIEFFPKDRLQCYRCGGDSDCDFTDGNSKMEKFHCNVQSEYDQCYTYQDKDKKMHRGCLSDTFDGKLLCVSDPSKCVKCKESGCNNQPKLRKPSLSCIRCDDDTDCGYEQNKTKSKACTTQMVPYNIKQSCYARTITKDKDIKSFERGCTAVDLTQPNPAGKFGAMCSESGCNTQNIIVDQCQKCSSKLGGECSVAKGKKFLAECSKSYPYGKKGCFTYVKDNIVERGCVKDLKDRYEECLKNPNACVICKIDDCNNEDRNKDERNFGHRTASTILLNIFAVFVLFMCY